MIETILLGLFSILFAYIAKNENTRWSLKISFVLIFLFLALRYNFGNDYEKYLNRFIEIGSLGRIDFWEEFEPGWTLLNWLFQPLGFFAMTAVLALFNCVIYYRFLVKHVPVSYYWFAVFLYIFYPDFMLVHSSAMRQSIAITIFIFSLDYLYKKDAIRYFLCIGLASLFHFTALILIPVYLLTFLNQKLSKIYCIIFVFIYVLLFIFGQYLSNYVIPLVGVFSEKYEFYQNAGVVNTGFGFIYYSALLVLLLYFERFQHLKIALFFRIAIIGFLFMPLTLIIEMISRLGMYFAPATIIAYPNIIKVIKKPINKIILLTLLITITIYQFVQFFNSDTYKDNFGTYQTIFSTPQWY